MAAVDQARELAQDLLAEALPRRWAHVKGVARRAERVAAGLSQPGSALIAAAWLHDIGYADAAKNTGFHPLDGGRYLRRFGLDEQIVRLVAHHSFALLEAAERGLDGELAAEFPPGDPILTDALCFADMTTSPDGEPVDPDDRLTEIQARYGPGDVVTRFIDRARPDILAAVTRTRERLAAADTQPI
ncbi:MAG TPA: HD domain-containing protein [Streptosporangiaceae bacterium]|nr:HD domain-containing protein [Streptosporangiaceae bacterium]